MIKTLIERIDIYLVLLVLASAYILIFSDSRYFQREDKEKARKQSIMIGIVMLLVTVSLYIVRQTWL